DRIRRICQRGDADLWRPLGDESELWAGPDGDLDRSGGERLLDPRTAAEIDALHVEPVPLEDAVFDADLHRHELERAGLRPADADLGLRLGRLAEWHVAKRDGQRQPRGKSSPWTHVFPCRSSAPIGGT